MKVVLKYLRGCCLMLSLALPAAAETAESKWPGVDVVVIERLAKEAGHSPRAPFINTDQGDLLLFLFLLAGAFGGFIVGYAYRSLVLQSDERPRS